MPMGHSTANNYLSRSTLKTLRHVRYSPTLYSWRSHPWSLLTFFSRDWWLTHSYYPENTLHHDPGDTLHLSTAMSFQHPCNFFLNNSLNTSSSSFLRKGLQEVSFKNTFCCIISLIFLLLNFLFGKVLSLNVDFFFIGLLMFFSSLYFIF